MRANVARHQRLARLNRERYCARALPVYTSTLLGVCHSSLQFALPVHAPTLANHSSFLASLHLPARRDRTSLTFLSHAHATLIHISSHQ